MPPKAMPPSAPPPPPPPPPPASPGEEPWAIALLRILLRQPRATCSVTDLPALWQQHHQQQQQQQRQQPPQGAPPCPNIDAIQRLPDAVALRSSPTHGVLASARLSRTTMEALAQNALGDFAASPAALSTHLTWEAFRNAVHTRLAALPELRPPDSNNLQSWPAKGELPDNALLDQLMGLPQQPLPTVALLLRRLAHVDDAIEAFLL